MKSFWYWLKDYFDLSFGERRGVMWLLGTIFLLIGLRYALPYLMASQTAEYDFTEIKKLAAQLEENKLIAGRERETPNDFSLHELEGEADRTTASLFYFDPNTATQEDFQLLGLSAKQSKTIINYRNKGGKFFKKEDLQKIYGLRPGQYRQLEPFIKLPSKNTSKEERYTTEKPAFFAHTTPEKVMVELNVADSADLLKVRGIGPAFASRIARYRKILGGFIHKEQLLEVYGMDSSRFFEIENQLVIKPEQLVKLNINTAGVEELRRHPYIKYKLANAIINYRQRNGNYKNVEDMRKIYLIDQQTFEKIRPYVAVE